MCCGKSRAQFQATIPRLPPAGFAPQGAHQQGLSARLARATFEYVGRTRLTVKGPVTGRPYHFDRPGSKVQVDARDAASLAAVPMLRQAAAPPEA
jgi:hypothetical protein